MCNTGKKNSIIRITAIILLIALALPMAASAAEAAEIQARGSIYLDSYNAYLSPAGSGKIHVCFAVTGNGYMDTIGALTIKLYESTDNGTWTWVKSYSNGNYPEMISYDDYYHSGYMTYQGVAGRYYKAYACIWAGKDGGGDTRYFWTSVKQAT